MDLFILCLSLPYCLLCFMQPCGHLLGNAILLGYPVFYVFMCILNFPLRYPGSDVVLGCLDS